MTGTGPFGEAGPEAPAAPPDGRAASEPESIGPEPSRSENQDEMSETSVPRAKRRPAFLVLSVLASIGGVAAFLWLFIGDFNIYWLILSPIIIALYQFPAVFFFWLYKGGRAHRPRLRIGRR